MSFSLNRNEFVANKLGNLNGEKILDIGCRDKIFKKYLKGNFKYKGIDYKPDNLNNDVDDKEFINHNLELGLPNDSNYDIINALDVLEHLENIHNLFQEIFKKSNKKIVIALPNMGYYKFRLKFLFKGEISEKYIFHKNIVQDRHKWIPNYKSIMEFIEENTPAEWKLTKFNFIAERKKKYAFYYIEKFLSKFLPGLFVYELIFIFEKK